MEANLLVMLSHSTAVMTHLRDGFASIEHMLTSQLVAAIGKTVSGNDFSDYMRYHNRKIFRAEYAPQPFCYAIRRPDHYPDGTLTIESGDGSGNKEPAYTTVAGVEPVLPMSFAINAATRVSFTGGKTACNPLASSFAGLVSLQRLCDSTAAA